jgi:hypothetical protein
MRHYLGFHFISQQYINLITTVVCSYLSHPILLTRSLITLASIAPLSHYLLPSSIDHVLSSHAPLFHLRERRSCKQAKPVSVIDYNAVMKATKHHDPYVQAMEQLHCITKDLTTASRRTLQYQGTASRHQVMDLERQMQRKKTYLNRIKSSKRRFPTHITLFDSSISSKML